MLSSLICTQLLSEEAVIHLKQVKKFHQYHFLIHGNVFFSHQCLLKRREREYNKPHSHPRATK